jgi:DNA gyrase subunit A
MEVITRKTQYELKEAEKRAHILEGLLIALDHLDQVIALIRGSKDPDEARAGLMTNFDLSEIQARAILDMRLQRLTGLERDKITEEYKQIKELIDELNSILASEEKKKDIIKSDLQDLKTKFGDARRSKIEMVGAEFNIEDMIPDDEMLVTVSSQGYIKRTNLAEYKTQGRGGTGSRGVKTKDQDYTEHLFMATNHNYLLFFTEKGKLFWLRVFETPEGNKTSKGRAIQNLINIESDDKIKAVLNVKTLTDEDYIKNNYIVMCTKKGTVKKTLLELYSRPRQNGIIAININDGDTLIDVALTNGNDYIIIAASLGKAVRFHEAGIRPMGRGATGVRGISLAENDFAIGMICVGREDAQLLVVSENGFGKRSDIEDYRITSRGAKGVKSLNITDKVGNLVAIKEVTDEDDLMIITNRGIAIRIHVSDLRIMGRNTQGVKLIKLSDKDGIASVTRIVREEDEEEIVEGEVTLVLDDTLPLSIDSPNVADDSTESTEEEEPTEES